MKYLSLFTGIGGFELGIQRASDKQSATIEQDGQRRNGNTDKVEHDVLPTSRTTPLCIGYSEIDKYAIQTYERHFKHDNYGDATTINAKELPDFDLLVGGFPCQAFSIAGKRRGFDEARGTLFFDVARILAEKRPRHLVLENVKGLLSHDTGKTFQTILGVLADLGYRVEWQVLNSKDFGVPQNRERVYFVGHLRGECSGQVFPITGTNQKDTRIIGQDVAYTIDANYHKGTNTLEKSRRSIVQVNQPKHSNDRVYSDEGISPTLNTMQGGNRQPFITNPKMNDYKPNYKRVGAITASSYKEPPVVNAIRRLTPTECERLQGFPDGWTLGSDTQRYKQCGNAVTVNTVQAVMTNLIKECEV